MRHSALRRNWAAALTLLAVLALAPQAGFAAVPQTINYQGSLSDSAGDPVNGTVDMTFKLYSDSGGTTLLWTEIHDAANAGQVTVTNGVFNVTLGAFTALDPSYFDNPVWLEITVAGEVMTPLQAVDSVAYAQRAKGAEAAVFAVVSLDLSCTACVAATELDFDTATQAELDSHTATPGAHHVRYTDAEAITAVGPHTTDTTLTEGQVETFVTNGALDFAAGSTVGTLQILTPGSSLNWADLINVPADIADGDQDTLGGVAGCTNGQVAKSDGAGGWACGNDIDTDTNTGVTDVVWAASASTPVGASAAVTATATCTGGKVATGGGWQADSQFVEAVGSYPDTATGNPATAWKVDVFNTDTVGHNVTAYAICVTP